jgi:hypothetical protein
VAYLVVFRDGTFSIPWTFGFLACAASVAAVAWLLNAPARFPRLDRHLFYSGARTTPPPLTHEEWLKQYAEWEQEIFEYNISRVQLRSIVFTPAEDGLICVPLLLVGLNPISAIGGGIVFGILHLRGCTYLDCIFKTAIYSLVCLFVLPHGLLTVVVGHFVNDFVGWVALKAMLKFAPSESLKAQGS